jgi:serine/threonine protein kinase
MSKSDTKPAEVPRSVRLPPKTATANGGSGLFVDVGSLHTDNNSMGSNKSSTVNGGGGGGGGPTTTTSSTLKGNGITSNTVDSIGGGSNTSVTKSTSNNGGTKSNPNNNNNNGSATTSKSSSESATNNNNKSSTKKSTNPPPANNNDNNRPHAPPDKVERPRDTAPALSKADTVIPQTNFSEWYTLGKELGKGNYSVVHEATDKRTGEKVAVKIMDKRPLNDIDIREIKEEVSILDELNHPNIIRLFGFFEDEIYFYIVTEIMEGGELFDEIVEREFYWERDAQEVVRMLADALNYMHKKGIVHRDLKPENILLTTKGKDGVVKLADFGFAARIDLNNAEHQLKTACGTPGYVSPEIVAGLKYGPETDVWSLGIITFVLLAGYPPFHDEDVQELFRLIRRGKFSFDPAYWSVVSAEAKLCVKAMMMVDRSQRLTAQGVLNHPWIAHLSMRQEKVAYTAKQTITSSTTATTTTTTGSSSESLQINVEQLTTGTDGSTTTTTEQPTITTTATATTIGGDGTMIPISAVALQAKDEIRRLSQSHQPSVMNGGVGGRGLGGEGRGPQGSVNLTPTLAALKKFQARRRWKDGLVMALIREGQGFAGGFQDISEVMGEVDVNNTNRDGIAKMKGTAFDTGFKIENEDDLTQLGGLGTSDVLTRLQLEKRQAAAQAIISKGS